MYGAPKSMLSLAKGLPGFGYDVTVASSKDDLLLNEAKKEKLNTLSLNVPDLLLISRKKASFIDKIRYFLCLIFFWCKVFSSNGFDKYNYICINDIRSFLLFFPIVVRQRKKIYWYVRINDRVPIIHPLALLLSNKVILISSDCIKSFTEREKLVFKDKFFILNTGFVLKNKKNPYQYIQENHSDGDIVFTSVGSICARKNQIAVITSFYNLSLDNKHLYIVGSPASELDNLYYNEARKLVDDLKLNDTVTFIEHTPHVLCYLKHSNYFLFASHMEGLPRVVIEAIMCGCFVISSNVDGISDILIDKRFGVYTNCKATDESFDSQFLELINSSINQSDGNKPDLEHFKKRFSYEKYIDGFIKIINS